MLVQEIKDKIRKSLDSMSESQLKSAWLILKELRNQEQYQEVKVDRIIVNEKIAIGIKQLDNNEGTDFREFLNGMHLTWH